MLWLFILRDIAPVGVWIRFQFLRNQHAEQYAELRPELALSVCKPPPRCVFGRNAPAAAAASFLTELEYITACDNDDYAHY